MSYYGAAYSSALFGISAIFNMYSNVQTMTKSTREAFRFIFTHAQLSDSQTPFVPQTIWLHKLMLNTRKVYKDVVVVTSIFREKLMYTGSVFITMMKTLTVNMFA